MSTIPVTPHDLSPARGAEGSAAQHSAGPRRVLFRAPVTEAFAAAGRLRALGVSARLAGGGGLYAAFPTSRSDELIIAVTVAKWAPRSRRLG